MQIHVNLVITDFLTNLYEYDQVNGRTYDKKRFSGKVVRTPKKQQGFLSTIIVKISINL